MLIALLGEGWYIEHQRISLTRQGVDIAQLKDDLQKANQEVTRLSNSKKVDNEQVAATEVVKQAATTVAEKAKENVRNAAKDEAAGTINSDAADAVYLDSMWITYCHQVPDNPACTSRLLSTSNKTGSASK